MVQRLTMLAPVEREKGTGGPTPDQKQRWKAWYGACALIGTHSP